MESPTLGAETTIQASLAYVRQWFVELEAHPERYRFETHEGFAFTQGDFGTAGARFQTWERFYGLQLALHFELTGVDDAGCEGSSTVRFRLVRPRLPVWGAFVLEGNPDGTTRLRLVVGGTTCAGARFLMLPLVRGAILKQIRQEVEHIKGSIR